LSLVSQAKKKGFLHVDPAQRLVDGPGLHVRHGLELHLVGDDVDDIGMNEASSGEIFELRNEHILLFTLFRRLCRNLLPLCAVVEASDGGIRKARRL
jgi:hypothetical protein